MSTWTSDELNKVGTAEELRIASRRGDGTLRKPVTIWVVRHGDDVYVRSVNGPGGAWFRGVRARHAGHISAGPVDADVLFETPADARLPAAMRLLGIDFSRLSDAVGHA